MSDIGETSIGIQWAKPNQVSEQILSYELYWNDTYAKVKKMCTFVGFNRRFRIKEIMLFVRRFSSLLNLRFLRFAQEKHHRRIPVSENYSLTGLYPNTMYYVWLAAKSQRGEGAPTPPIQVRTKQYGKSATRNPK